MGEIWKVDSVESQGNDLFLKKKTTLREKLIASLRMQKSENVIVNTICKTLILPSCAHASNEPSDF